MWMYKVSLTIQSDFFYSQWRFVEISITFLVLSIHHEEPLPARAVKAIINGLVHDALAIRKVCSYSIQCSCIEDLTLKQMNIANNYINLVMISNCL